MEEKEYLCGWPYCRGFDYIGFPGCQEICEEEEEAEYQEANK